MINFTLYGGDVLSLILALHEAERSSERSFPATAGSYRKLRVKLDGILKDSGYLEKLRK